ncbi:MAG: hypothetical protein WD431_01690 [Cyclobacteriaceae bacterium]
MQRRKFIHKTGVAVTAITALPSMVIGSSIKNNKKGADEIIKKLSLLNDNDVADYLSRQVSNFGDRWDGGVEDKYKLANAHTTKELISVAGSAYASEFSNYYLSPDLIQPIERAAACLVNIQHDDGTIDLHSTNFHSTPDTAFIVNDLCPVFICLKQLNRADLKGALNSLEIFLSRAGEAFAVGGIHTANHRWVVCSALAWVHHLFPSQKYVDRIDEWLSEGIDFDPDGQYSEKSVGVYSPIVNTMFITIGRLLNRPELHEYARKNLEMSLYYIQPGGEVVTDASGRQDSAYTAYADWYYYAYRYLAITDNNPEFSAVCKLIERNMPEKIIWCLPYLMEDSIFHKALPKASEIPSNYFKRFSYSGLFRIRRGTTDITIIENNPTFLSYRKGDAILQSIRLGASFFGSRGRFISENCVVKGNKIILSKSKTHGYMQPIPKEGRTGDVFWGSQSLAEREKSELQTINYRVEIVESDGKILMELEITGTDYVPVSLEMSFKPGGKLKGLVPDSNAEDSYFLESGMGQYIVGEDVINFGPGANSHKWAQMRGMLPKQDGHSVYITGYTPFKHTLEIY